MTNLDVLPSGVALIRVPLTQNNVVNPNDPATIRAGQRAGQPVIQRVPPRRVPQRGSQSFQWTATDKNQDTLEYDLYYRGDNERTWKLLKKDLDENFYMINSDTLPDGTYVVRVVASDTPSNPPDLALKGDMESRPFSIDNTPPVTTMKLESTEKGRVRIAIDATDETSTLNQAEVSVDTGDWQAGVSERRNHRFKIGIVHLSLQRLTSGEHVIAFRIYDQNDNAGLAKLVVRIP